MDNKELKIKSTDVAVRIEQARKKGEDVTPLLREKMELLQIGYKKLSESLKEDKFEKNPKKYSTLLSYLNNIKKIQQEINLPQDETDKEISNIHAEMNRVGLGWLLGK